jgi:carboxylesterase type B
VLAQYNDCAGYPSVDGCSAVVLRDYIFTCPTRRAAAAQANAGSARVWVYQFKYASEWLDMKSCLGNYHTSELYFV